MEDTTQALISRLVVSSDYEGVLRELGISPAKALGLLGRGKGKRNLAARKALAEVHAQLVANRFSAYAVQRLCELLQSDKPELRLKGATSILKVAGVGDRRRSAKKAAKAAGEEASEAATTEDRALMELLAELLRQKVSAGASGPPVLSGKVQD